MKKREEWDTCPGSGRIPCGRLSDSEPTHLKIAPLCRGILWGKLTIEGRAGHIELKQGDFRTGGAVDAIDKASLYLEQFRRLNKEWSVAKEHKYLPIPCQIHIAQFQAGEYPTTFANRAELHSTRSIFRRRRMKTDLAQR